MPDFRPVKIKGTDLANNLYVDGDARWVVANLVERAKGLEPFDLPLCALDISSKVWAPVECAHDLARHLKRVMEVDITRPVILDHRGFIMDGWHRVTRALLDGRATIPAVRFEETPPPDYVETGE